MKNSANLRGIAQSFAIFGNSNNDFLPGLSSNGEILSPAEVGSPDRVATGASIHQRLWILLNGQYLGGDLLINPQDSLVKWVSGSPVTAKNNSYAGLQIGDSASATTTAGHQGRASEWKNNANSQAVMMGDRLLVPGEPEDAKVRSVWTTKKGDWKGNLVWGDVHAEFAQTHRGFQTRYNSATATAPASGTPAVNTNDNLFVTQGSPVASEDSVSPDANAMQIYF